MPLLTHSPRTRMWGNALFYLITLAIVTASLALALFAPRSETLTILQRTESGSALFSLNIDSGALEPLPDAAPTTEPLAFVRLPDGSVVSMAPMGLVKRTGSTTGTLTLLLASAVPANPRTPFAISQDGTRVAWRNPSDGSLQIFVASNDTFIPIATHPTVRPTSLAFTTEGTLVAAVREAEATTIYRSDVGNGMSPIASITGLVTILP